MIVEVKQIQRQRLVDYFGEAAADIILEHKTDLEQTFGSASGIILKIMEGQLPQHPKKGGK